jgi:hypothetical protein
MVDEHYVGFRFHDEANAVTSERMLPACTLFRSGSLSYCRRAHPVTFMDDPRLTTASIRTAQLNRQPFSTRRSHGDNPVRASECSIALHFHEIRPVQRRFSAVAAPDLGTADVNIRRNRQEIDSIVIQRQPVSRVHLYLSLCWSASTTNEDGSSITEAQ